ncbi:Protein of unknown function DUF262 [Cnuella takakiae]|uniref:GmrSD restriction endonucleases N-terminal domain-containing protein n=1 Tax=Cnuella takakiae TaxID=1302690 RepID=A0A1M5CHF6_9BACT|nr:DUF262 domain-containing protein [Cnuella takakiae]OLY91827.1 hypothetical protein BUE76_07880 [Cnuella takakiae]SHF54204.1 Protein of unknown function DUF262 [Cnuella takakiae]
MEIRDIFENFIKIEPKVMSIETLFNNEERVSNTNYQPFYQRNYVWDDEKATYFIESILLGTEIPPLIYFRNSDKVEVIDGRQRYQTILRFKNNEFKLKKNGLQKLQHIGIANKYFKNLEEKLKDFFWNTKLRIIEFSFHSKSLVNDEIEEVVKKEIFKRYNSGITPLKPTDIDKAAYIDDDLNSYLKNKIVGDQVLHGEISGLLHFENSNIEILLKKVRQLLVLHKIPIKYYSIEKDSVIAKYFEFLSSNITSGEVEEIYRGFIKKINLLKQLSNIFKRNAFAYNRLIFECIFWGLSIIEVETGSLTAISAQTLEELAKYISDNKDVFKMERSSFFRELNERFFITSEFFRKKFSIDFTAYLLNNPEFKASNRKLKPKENEVTSFDELRINKPEPSSIAIEDISRQMMRQRFLVRPSYQRNEVINKKKSSAIIESILMGIKLPPIFVFKRKDDVSEVLDGQQRLLSILGFMKKPYLDEKNEERHSDKNGYSLNLKNGILKGLDGKNFEQLTKDQKDKIKNFDLWIIEISEKNNEHFESIDLFIRLNSKPYPIKEDTFEMWNSYVSRDIIETIKSIHRNNKDWFYLRKNNQRMEDENIYTSLIYLQYQITKGIAKEDTISRYLDIYKIGDKINLRVKSKNDITKVLENNEAKEGFVATCFQFEFDFLKKLKELLSDDATSTQSINQNLDDIFNKENNRRTQQSFYALWYFLYDLPYHNIISNKEYVRSELHKLFSLMDKIESKSDFDDFVSLFKTRFKNAIDNSYEDVISKIQSNAPVSLGSIANIQQGLNYSNLEKYSSSISSEPYIFIKETSISDYRVNVETAGKVSLDEKDNSLKEIFDSKHKIVIKRINSFTTNLDVGIYTDKAVFNNNVLITNVVRYGYHPKFILCLLGSRLITHFLFYNSSALNGAYSLTSNNLRKVPLPIISLRTQSTFVKIIEYILVIEGNKKIIGFFERLLDAMVYELYFKKQILEAKCEVLVYLEDLPEINDTENSDVSTILEIYAKISDPYHPISIALLKLFNVPYIVQIEGTI